MSRVTFRIDAKTKRKFQSRIVGDGATMSDILTDFVKIYGESGLRFGGDTLWNMSDLPELSVVYFAYDIRGVRYIGQTTNLRQRIQTHHRANELSGCRLAWIVVPGNLLRMFENVCVDIFAPDLNKRPSSLSDGTTLTFRCDPDLNRQVKVEAAKRDMNRTEFIIEALLEKLEQSV
jgi:hypothetical protein